ncbi:hypothetical protein [Streptomyces sp. RFCAC02]|uniref:hypothetical protein n=1 Tax=Streptomyces sp. RFCAC02 TaxID=2499143 RepID=UPI001020D4F4|nr:hypothetical protein [Streptomyces sp. RFCAC02]
MRTRTRTLGLATALLLGTAACGGVAAQDPDGGDAAPAPSAGVDAPEPDTDLTRPSPDAGLTDPLPTGDEVPSGGTTDQVPGTDDLRDDSEDGGGAETEDPGGDVLPELPTIPPDSDAGEAMQTFCEIARLYGDDLDDTVEDLCAPYLDE